MVKSSSACSKATSPSSTTLWSSAINSLILSFVINRNFYDGCRPGAWPGVDLQRSSQVAHPGPDITHPHALPLSGGRSLVKADPIVFHHDIDMPGIPDQLNGQQVRAGVPDRIVDQF